MYFIKHIFTIIIKCYSRNFIDFSHSFLTIFRVISGEWVEPLNDCMLVARVPCVPFFFATFVIGRLVIVNLFLVILIACRASSYPSDCILPDEETVKLREAIDRIPRFFEWAKTGVQSFVRRSNQTTSPPVEVCK